MAKQAKRPLRPCGYHPFEALEQKGYFRACAFQSFLLVSMSRKWAAEWNAMCVRLGCLLFVGLALCVPAARAEWDGQAVEKMPDSTLLSQDTVPRANAESLSIVAPTKSQLRAKAREERQIEAWRHSAASGFQMVRLGNGLLCSGLGIAALGALFDLPVLWVGGAITSEFGLPIAGIGAGKSNRASGRLAKTRNAQGVYAWPAYIVGWGLLFGAVVALSSDTETQQDPITGKKTEVSTDDAVDLARLVAITGLATHTLAWYGFSKKAEGARENLSRLAVMPNLEKDRRGISGAGLTLALRF